MPPTPKVYSLGLDDDGDDEGEHPYRFVTLPCKSRLAYGGDNGNLSLWNPSDNTHKIVQRFDDGIRAVATSSDGKRIAVGFDTGSTHIYTFDDYDVSNTSSGSSHPFCQTNQNDDNDDLLSQDFMATTSDYFLGPQFDSPIRDLCFYDKHWLVVASESGLCMVNAESRDTLKDRELEQDVQEHHDHCGIRGVSIEGKTLATLAMDGRLCLWDLEQRKLLLRDATTCISKTDVGEVHGANAFDRSCRPWLQGGYIVTPGKLKPCIRKWDGKNLQDPLEVEGDGHADWIVYLVPASQQYWVSSGRDGKLVLWKLQKDVLEPVETVCLESPATDLLVDGTNVLCACVTGSGAIVNLEESFSKQEETERSGIEGAKKANVTGDLQDDDSDDGFGSDPVQASKAQKRVLKKSNDDTDDDDDVDFSSDAAPSKSVRFVEDEAAEDDDEDVGVLPKETSTESLSQPVHDFEDEAMPAGNDDLNDDMDDDPGYIPLQQNQLLLQPEIPYQPAFSPSSTPLDLARRFLCWNHIGAITMLQGDRNTIDITFTDSAYKRPISFTDNVHFLLGSLGEDGGIFASDLQDDDDDNDADMDDLDGLQMSERTKQAVKESHKKRKDGKPTGSSIFFYRFETFGNIREKDWYITLPDGERVLGTASGEGWAAAMTNRRFLRLFTSGGNQSEVMWLKGDPVTMAGRSRFLAVFYHEARPLQDKTQQLGYTLWDVTNFKIISEGSVSCISKGSSLTWVGFSNDCSLMVMDSDGMVSMLVACGKEENPAWGWSPVLDTMGLRKSADDQFWPVTVYDGKLVCVPLKGGNTYPDAARRPVTSTLGLRIPLAKASVAKNSALEELSVRANLALTQKKIVYDMGLGNGEDDFEREYLTLSAQVDKVTLKLFAATVEAGKLERALDLVDRLHLEKSYDLAIKLADHHRKLADLIEDARERKFAEEDSDDEHEGESTFPGNTRVEHLAPRQISPDNSHTFKIQRSLGHLNKPIAKKVRIG